MSSLRYCAQADRYKKHNCCEALISTESDYPKGYDALCVNCKLTQMQDDIAELEHLVSYIEQNSESPKKIEFAISEYRVIRGEV